MPCELCLAGMWWVQSTFEEGQFVVAGETGINVPPLQSLSFPLHRVLIGLPSQVADEQLCSLWAWRISELLHTKVLRSISVSRATVEIVTFP